MLRRLRQSSSIRWVAELSGCAKGRLAEVGLQVYAAHMEVCSSQTAFVEGWLLHTVADVLLPLLLLPPVVVQAFLSRLLLMLGSFVIMCLLLF